MARDLRAVFGSNDGDLAADEAFTNRQAQWAHVTSALSDHLQRVNAAGFDVEDLETPRHNVLVFHGVGGIGKTTLSRKVEAALGGHGGRPAQWGEATWPGARVVPVRIDLARSAGTDIEQVVLTLRLALARLGRPLPAFDIALRRYWETNHPGEPLEEYLRRGGLAGKFGEALPQQMQSALADVAQALLLPGTIGTVVGEAAGSLIGALRERRQTVRALAGCARLADLLEAEPDTDALSYYPHLLAWELARLPQRVVPVVLLDTFEDTGDRTRREMERLLQRMVWLMPNALFIITGRSRLDWAEESLAGQLDFTGPHAWPQLTDPGTGTVPGPRTATGSMWAPERQVLIGDFSLEDCDGYLTRRLSHQGRPLIGAELRRVISERSHGLPLYLDLSVMRFLHLRRTGHTPHASDFDADFPALISRTLQDLTPDERHVLRSVSLLDAFDVPLATAAAGLAHEAAAQRLIERPFVRHHPFALWPHHLHALIRTTLRSARDHTDDRWSERDWQHAAERAFTALGDTWRSHPDDRLLLLGSLRQGLALARDFAIRPGWLTDAAWHYVSDSIWEPITLTAPVTPPPAGTATSPADAIVDLLSALARRQHEHREHTVHRLTSVLDAGALPDDLVEMAVYYRAKAQRDLGRSTDSRAGMQYVVDHGSRLAPAARRGLVHLARLAGDFRTAHTTAQLLGWEGRQHRVLGDIYWPHGDMHRAAVEYLAGRTEAEQHGKSGEAVHNQVVRAFVLAFTDPARADDEIDLAHHLLHGKTLRASALTVQLAALVRDAGLTEDIEDRARLLRTEVSNAGITSAAPLLELALAFHHAVLGDHRRIDAGLDRLNALDAGSDHSYCTDIIHFMDNRPLPHTTEPKANWLEPEQQVRERWRALVTTRQVLSRRE